MAVVPSDREAIMANAANKALQDLGYASHKPEQLQVVAGVLFGCDVFRVLPTGFRKTLCYTVLPSTFDQVYAGRHPSIVLVVSPLTAIIIDQRKGVCTHSCDNTVCVLHVLHNVTFLRYRSLMVTSPDYFYVARIVRLRQTSSVYLIKYS